VLVLVLTATLAWYFDGFDPYSGTDAEVPAAAGNVTMEVEPPAWHEGPGEEAMREAESPAQPSPPLAAPAPADEPVEAPAPDMSVPASVETPQASVELPASPAAGETALEAADAPVASDPGRLVFRLEGESWLEVRDRSDRRLYSGLSAAGSVRVVQGLRPFVITIGNAAGVKLEHAGREVDLKPHTSPGGVARLKLE
jgi:cytoskeleton protein RodZ